MPGKTIELTASTTSAGRGGRITAVQQIYSELRHQIVDLTMEPGTVLSSKELATAFGVSPTPVREALMLMEQEGLVDVVPQSRTTVSLIDVQHARETHFLRLSVEVEVARTLAKAIDGDNLAELKVWIERQIVELKADNHSEFKMADNAFHAALFRFAGVEGLSSLLDTRRGHYDRIRGLYLLVQERRKVVVEEHQAILAALENRDEAAAEAAVRRHLGKSLAIVDDIRARHPRYFL